LLIALAWAAWPALQRLPALRALPLLGALWGGLLLVGAAAGGDDIWQPLRPFAGSGAAPTTGQHTEDAFVTVSRPEDLQRELDAAKARGQWVMLDYYADWCVSCKVMEKQVFGKAHVLEALSDVRLLRLDVTADNAASRELLGRYKVPGPPSLLWIGADGIERRSQRITGEVDAGTFLQRWTTTRDAR